MALVGGMGAGLYAYRKAHVVASVGTEHYGALLEGMNLGTSGFKDLDGRPRADTGFVRNEWMVKGRYIPNPDDPHQHQIDLKLGYSDERSNETYLGLTDADFRANPQRRYAASNLDRMQ